MLEYRKVFQTDAKITAVLHVHVNIYPPQLVNYTAISPNKQQEAQAEAVS